MKHLVAIILLCLPAQISAGGRCPYAHANRAEVARAATPKPQRAETVRAQKVRAIVAWQRAVLFEQQIL